MSARAAAGAAAGATAGAKPAAAAGGASTAEGLSATVALVRLCWDAIARKLGHDCAATPAEVDTIADSAVRVPLFVTIKKLTKAGKYELRGCIGSLSPRPLADLSRYALKSAFEDRRFDPLEAHELELLEVSISLLVCYEDAAGPEDWIVGLHGVIIAFAVEGDDYSATYLPEVAAEMRWSQRDAIISLVRKAGFTRPRIPREVWDTMRVTRYRSTKAALSYHEWQSGATV